MQHHPLDCVCFNTRKTARLLGQFYDRVLEPSGLRNTQFSALVVVSQRGPISITDLSQIMEIERTTLTRNLQVLQRGGLVKLVPGEDRRSKHVTITGKGRARLKAALPLWKSAQRDVLASFGQQRWQSLRAELEEVREGLHRAD